MRSDISQNHSHDLYLNEWWKIPSEFNKCDIMKIKSNEM